MPWSLSRMICIMLAFNAVALFVNEMLILLLAFDVVALVFDDVLCTLVASFTTSWMMRTVYLWSNILSYVGVAGPADVSQLFRSLIHLGMPSRGHAAVSMRAQARFLFSSVFVCAACARRSCFETSCSEMKYVLTPSLKWLDG